MTKQLQMFEEFTKEFEAEEQRKKEAAEQITPEQARIYMDSLESETLKEWIALMKYCDNLPTEDKIKEAELFLDRNEHTDRIFYLNGYSHMRRIAYNTMIEVENKIIDMRPHGVNTYCFKCDRCHDEGECTNGQTHG